MQERENAVTLKGNPVTLLGPEIKPGQKAPEFKLIDSMMKEVSSTQVKNKVKLISVVLSLDTPICDLQSTTFNEEVSKYSNVVGYSVSMDLPFCAARLQKERGIKKLKLLSDHREASFGADYGVLIKGLRLLARAVFIIDAGNIVRYVEYVPEVAGAPDYEKAAEMLKKIAKECL